VKKVTYGVRIGIIGSLNSGREILTEYLKRTALNVILTNEDGTPKDLQEFLVIYKDIPIKIRVYEGKNIGQATYDYDKLENLDVLIFTLNLYDFNSLKTFNKGELDELSDYIMFQGISILDGIQKDFSSQYRISEVELIHKAKELDNLYCFAIEDDNGDLKEFYDKVLNDFIFKFQFSSPELFEHAKVYGAELKRRQSVREEIQKELPPEEELIEEEKFDDIDKPKVVMDDEAPELDVGEPLIAHEPDPISEPEELPTEESKEEIEEEKDEEHPLPEGPAVVEIEDLKIVSIERAEYKDPEEIEPEYWKPKDDIRDKAVKFADMEKTIESNVDTNIPTEMPKKADDSIITVEKPEGRRKCPKCSEENKMLIHESVDKTNIILAYPRLYGKKYRCGSCGCVWREKQRVVS